MHQDALKGGRATRPPFSQRQRINVGGSPTLLQRPTATSRRYRRGSMWAGRPHSYGGQQLRVGDIGEDQCGRVAHTPIATSRRYRRGSMWAGRPPRTVESARINVGGSPTLLWRQVADIVEDRLLGLSIEIGEATGLERAERALLLSPRTQMRAVPPPN